MKHQALAAVLGAGFASLGTAPSAAHADEAISFDAATAGIVSGVSLPNNETFGTAPGDRPSDDEDTDAPYRFDGRGVFVMGGSGVVGGADMSDALAREFRVQLIWPFTEHLHGELTSSAVQFQTMDHHLEEVDVTGLGIGLGLRLAGSADWPVRPYGAARVMHMHMSPDPWGEHDYEQGDDSEAHTSHHRWGAAVGAGADVGLIGPASRFRVGLEGELGALSGPGVDVLARLLLSLGIGF